MSYFTNSGSEANELAVLMSREFTGRSEVISLRNAYHGGTQGTMALTAHGTWKFPSNPPSAVKNATPGYCYRCPFGLTYPSCDVRCARDVEPLIRYETCGEPACFIGEPIQGVGGTVTPPPEYFQIVYDIVRRYGGLCIADEVQTGFGRTGAALLGLRELGRDARPGDDGQGHRQRRAARRMRHAAGDRQDADQPRPLQHVWRQPDLDDAGPGDAGGHRPREHSGKRPRRRRASENPAARIAGAAAADRRSPRPGPDARRRTGPRPRRRKSRPAPKRSRCSNAARTAAC